MTTNYDTYLEDILLQERLRNLDDLGALLDAEVSSDSAEAARSHNPRLTVWVHDMADPKAEVLPEERSVDADADAEPSSVEVHLHYLHGRVPEEGAADGYIVLSEYDYAATRTATISTLRKLLTGDTAVLVLGASLTDPPLVDALALTRHEKSANEPSRPTSRFVLMPRDSFHRYDGVNDVTVANRLIEHLATRCEHLDTALLVPDFRYQTAQFLDELVYCALLANAEDYLSDETRRRYGLRLVDWWHDWHLDPKHAPGEVYRELCNGYSILMQLIESLTPYRYGDAKEDREFFRLEFWVREDPRHRRRLAMWADTGGPTFDLTSMKRSELAVCSTNASVRAFCEGRPQHLDVIELGGSAPSEDSRWQSYVAVPIYIPLSSAIGTPLGVITLASSKAKAGSLFPLLKLEDMRTIKARMITIARDLLLVAAPAQLDGAAPFAPGPH